jgi:mono/diheme cytochrome c family protein
LSFVALLLSLGAGEASAFDGSQGRALYITRCASCHLPEGQGQPGVAPPLRDRIRDCALQPAGWRYLARVVTFGLVGPIDIGGTQFDGVMPSFSTLSAEERAAILNYVATLATPGRAPAPLSPSDINAFTREAADPETLRRERPALLAAKHTASPSGEVGGVEWNSARAAYSRNCQGCHRSAGEGVPSQVPPLRHFVGYLMRNPAGRAYVPRVPGVAYSPLSDADLAALLNWLLPEFSARELPSNFTPYTTKEIAALRAHALTAVEPERERVLQLLVDSGELPRTAVVR